MKTVIVLACFMLSSIWSLPAHAQASNAAMGKSKSVKNDVTNAAGNMHLYPMPAKTYTNIYITWNNPQPFTVYIYDIDNVLIKQWDEGPKTDYQKALDVSKMAPGEYHLKVKGTRGEFGAPLSIVR